MDARQQRRGPSVPGEEVKTQDVFCLGPDGPVLRPVLTGNAWVAALRSSQASYSYLDHCTLSEGNKGSESTARVENAVDPSAARVATNSRQHELL